MEKTEEEIKKIAEDLYRGYIFTDRHVENKEDIPSVFMSLCMLDKEGIDKLKNMDIGMIYEYIDKAMPRSINGMPIFFSFNILNKDDTKRVIDRYNRIIKAVENG